MPSAPSFDGPMANDSYSGVAVGVIGKDPPASHQTDEGDERAWTSISSS
jgi:hypothetical protein